MDLSSGNNENALKKNIESWSDDKLRQYYEEYLNSSGLNTELFDISRDMIHAAYIYVRVELTKRPANCCQ